MADRLNSLRNRALREQTITFAEALGQVGIMTIALKGSATLLDEPLQHDSCAMMSDIDLLVPSPQHERAMKIGMALGYTVAMPIADDSHSVVLRHPDCIATIDLHHDLGPQRHVLVADEAVDRAENVPGLPLWRLSPSDQAIHNIYHAQIQDRYYELAILSLHQLCNLGFLVERHGNRIDWDFVRSQFERRGYRFAFLAYLYAAERLLGIQASSTVTFGRSERVHFKQMMLQLDWRWIRNLVTYPAILTSGTTEDRISYRRAMGLPIQSSAAALTKLAIRALRRHRHAAFTKLAHAHRRRFGLR